MPHLSDTRTAILINKRLGPGPGRPHGSKNKATESIRWGFVEAYRQLGGVDGLVQWGREKPDLFYPMLTKLLPVELAEGGHGNGITVIVQRHYSNKDTEQSSKGSEVLSAQVSAVIEGGEIPDSRGQGMGPDLGTLTHDSGGSQTPMHDSSGAEPLTSQGGYFGRAREGKGSPTGGGVVQGRSE